MSLQVIENISAAVHTYPGGTIAVRCADYMFPSTRGTLTIVSDADSISGDVVHESQALPYSTSAGFGGGLPADYEYPDVTAGEPTLLIPIADLPLNPNILYAAFMHRKVVGAGSTAHRIGEDFMQASVQDVILYGYNDTVNATTSNVDSFIPRPTTNPTYRLIWFQYIDMNGAGWDGEPGTPTDLLVMAAAGEDSTYETYLDALILIPYQAASSVPYWHYLQYLADPTGFDPLIDLTTFDPKTTSAADDAEATNGLTTATQDAQFSVIFAESQGFSTNFTACGGDYQRARTEFSFDDIQGFGLWDGTPTWPDDPSSWIAMTAGPKLIPAHTVETETFSDTVTPDENRETFPSTSGAYYWEITNDLFGFATSGTGLGVYYVSSLQANSSTVTTCAFAQLGNVTFPSDSPTHSNAKQTLDDMSNCILEATAEITSVPDSTAYAVVGWVQGDWPDYNASSPDPRTIAGVFLYQDGGNMKATLRADAHVGPFDVGADFGTAAATVGASTDVIRVKIERRYYVWRAKVWVDGGGEPGSWTLEGYLPNFYTDLNSSPTVLNVSQYPYSNVDRDAWGQNCRAMTRWFPMVGTVVQPSGSPSGGANMSFDEVAVTYDPNGTTMSPMHFNLSKYDGSVDYGTVGLEGDRVVLASFAGHTFDHDTHGTTVWMWTDAGAPDLQPAIFSDLFIRAPFGLIYGDIKRP